MISQNNNLKFSKKNKIFLFNPYPGIGGSDTTINRFLKSINYNKFEVEYLSLKKVKYNVNKKIIFKKLNSKSTFSSFFEIYKIIKNDKHPKKIFFSMQYFVNVWTIIFIKLILGIKILIYDINHLEELNHNKNFKDYIKKKIIYYLVKIFYCYADIVAGNSRELADSLQKHAKCKVHTLYNPCFDKITKKKSRPYSNNKINVLCVSRFENQKDHITLLKAINCCNVKKNIILTLVGHGSKESEIKEYIKTYNIEAKIFTSTTKLSRFYKRSDLFISTSIYEGLPTTMVEAASYCLPIISSNFKSGSKEILLNGKSGTLFKIKDYKRLSKLIEQFYINPKFFHNKELLCRKYLNRFSIQKNTKYFNFLINSLV
jgi:glycosyltransferase involved in cell wall biosynthesis